jgi:hypothetical protein
MFVAVHDMSGRRSRSPVTLRTKVHVAVEGFFIYLLKSIV